MANEIRIGLLWHSLTSDNLGVGALTGGHLEILDGVAARLGLRPRYRVLGWADPRPPYFTRPDLEIAHLRMKDFVRPGGLWRLLRGSDIVLDIGAGDSFADIYGRKRILRMFAAQAMTLMAGRPLGFAPQTIGPFAPGPLRAVARRLLARAAVVASRDDLSTGFAREMGFRGPLVEATDVALRLPFERPAPRPAGGKVRVGLNVSGLLFNGGYTRDNMFGLKADYRALMAKAVDRFLARPEVELHLVGHVLSSAQPVEDDRAAALALAAGRPGVIVAPGFSGPSEAKSLIASMDFFAGARMHACIAAFSTGVPVLPMAYSRKFAGLFGTLGYSANADLKALGEAEVLAALDAAYEGRAALKAEGAAAFARGLARLEPYEAAVGALMERAARRAR